MGAVVDLEKKERTTSQFGAVNRSAMVKEKMSEFKKKFKKELHC